MYIIKINATFFNHQLQSNCTNVHVWLRSILLHAYRIITTGTCTSEILYVLVGWPNILHKATEKTKTLVSAMYSHDKI